MKHRSKPHYLIFIYKAAEDLLLSSSSELGIDLSEFGLPSSLEELKGVTKNCESDKEPRIKRLVNSLRKSLELARRERMITYLFDKK